MAGRRPKVPADSAREEQILAALRRGDTRGAAASMADVSRSTLYRMLESATFRDKVEKAEGQAESRHLAVVDGAAQKGNWQASAWWLERRRYQDYARHDKVEMAVDLKTVSARIADESGLDPDAVMAEAERHLAGDR